jgi:hypothetical protein
LQQEYKNVAAQNNKGINAALFFLFVTSAVQHFQDSGGKKGLAMQLVGPLHNLIKSDCAELLLLSRLTTTSHINVTKLCMPLQHKVVVSHQDQTF